MLWHCRSNLAFKPSTSFKYSASTMLDKSIGCCVQCAICPGSGVDESCGRALAWPLKQRPLSARAGGLGEKQARSCNHFIVMLLSPVLQSC